MYARKRMSLLINETITTIHKLRDLKGGEYAGDDDALANFRRNGLALGMSMEAVWAVYAAKHWDALQQYVKDINAGTTRVRMEPIEGRIDDLIVYLMLFKGICDEAKTKGLPSNDIEAEAKQGLVGDLSEPSRSSE